ncbi:MULTISPECIES: prenyltransferase/squalene oxidase repeat-containing protein [unclassified Streptomyces]|uniref:prenyltransferase/squalene oxidase repeat-containing protein n=1 Tax=unclassified Streptomyces TaxID=2593676 RepID=UPI002366766D|nr:MULTISPECIES: prenyltransferase/squalene oxidase repeat-containing protein [unclassified Streptomyces]MDF3146273.1 prenyltransferase/squalene oxidase repeat-containing protein [Streptomyces sp. T21Q-yed]WDF37696.1 prenyltransferase/squalene oxidase repeat-containing protein [Streptomyces sp. T12]
MYVRRSAAVLAATVVIGTATPVTAADSAPSASPSVAIPTGLYGTTDPTYDGVWRQSLALLALDTVGVKPAAKAVEWLTGQQCADGGFAPFRADVSKACDAKTPVDTNNTAAAVQALAALGGHDAVTGKAVAWLKSVQNKDGGWGYAVGGPSDANSTSVVIGALTAVGEKPGDVRKGGRSPYDALLSLAIPCGEDGGGAFAFQPDKKGKLAANADATAAAVVGALGKTLAGAAPKPTAEALACKNAADPEQAARNGAAYLVKALAKDDHLTSAMPGAENQPDYGNTADAVLALSTAGHGDKAADAMRWLGSHYRQWAEQAGPAAYAQLILAANTGFDVRDFDGTGDDLVERLTATGPAPEFVPAVKSPTASDVQKQADKDDDNGVSVWWIVGVGLVAGIGVGFLISGRNKGK